MDNASGDETPDAIRHFDWVRYTRLDRNHNFAGACNTGARLAQAPLVLFLNNDAYPLGDALGPLARALDRPGVTVAGGALFFEDGVTQCAGFVMLPNAHWHYSSRNLPAALDEVTRSRDALAVSGAAMAVRTQWFLDIGGFDESFVNGFEDVDLCMRARERGDSIVYVADARFAHYEAASARRYAREAENEARFYGRWAASLANVPRVARGRVGAIAVRAPAALPSFAAAALEDLETALRELGHPLVRGGVRAWQRIDARFRSSAAFEWFTKPEEAPAVAIEATGMPATLRTRGAADVSVPWLPCAGVQRVSRLPLHVSSDAACETIGVAGFGAAPPERRRAIVAALEDAMLERNAMRIAVVEQDDGAGELLQRFEGRAERVDALAERTSQPTAVVCVVHAGFTDHAAFGNVLLAQAGLPPVVAGDELRALFASDVASFATDGDVTPPLRRLLNDVRAREREGTLAAADARRRFSPRRSAIRVVDLLCAARFGFERPAAARANTPLGKS